MKLTLDHTHRLNLHALLGAQRADVGSIRAIWSIQDRLALDADGRPSTTLCDTARGAGAIGGRRSPPAWSFLAGWPFGPSRFPPGGGGAGGVVSHFPGKDSAGAPS